MTSMVKFTYEVAQDVKDGKMSLGEAVQQYGHLIDREDIEQALYNIDAVSYGKNEDGEDTIIIRGNWQTEWKDEEPED